MEVLSEILGNPDIIRVLTNFVYYMRNKKVLIIGAGGGGDTCGCLPMYAWLKQCGIQPILGSLTWERKVVVSDYGPRSFDQIDGLYDQVGTVAWGNEHSIMKKEKIAFQASRISKIIEQPIVFLDITKGAKILSTDLTQFCKLNHIEMLLPLDVGGDIIAQGTEPGLKSPLADALTLSAVAQSTIPKVLGIFALNCDGELTLTELNDYLQQYNFKGWVFGQHVHTEQELRFMEQTIQKAGAITEASMQPIRYLNGDRGTVFIRKGLRKVELQEIVTHTFLLRLEEIYAQCPIAKALASINSIQEASNLLLERFKLISEYEAERKNIPE
jgi:hypothetical protein